MIDVKQTHTVLYKPGCNEANSGPFRARGVVIGRGKYVQSNKLAQNVLGQLNLHA